MLCRFSNLRSAAVCGCFVGDVCVRALQWPEPQTAPAPACPTGCPRSRGDKSRTACSITNTTTTRLASRRWRCCVHGLMTDRLMFCRKRIPAYIYAQKLQACNSARVVQWIEYRFPKAKALGSNPSSCWQCFRLCHLAIFWHPATTITWPCLILMKQQASTEFTGSCSLHSTVTRSSGSKSCCPFNKGGAAEAGRQATSSSGVDASSTSQILSAVVTYINHTSSHPNPAAAD
jgi:hypothetical protein